MEEFKIVILNYVTNKEKKWTKLQFYFNDNDHFQDTDNVVGIQTMTCFFNGDVFDKLNSKMIGKALIGRIKSIPDYKNPLNTRNVLAEIDVDGRTISLE